MGFAFVPLLLALLYEPAVATLLQRPFTESVGPAFVWGSIPVLQTDPQHTSRVLYEVSKYPRLVPFHVCILVHTYVQLVQLCYASGSGLLYVGHN